MNTFDDILGAVINKTAIRMRLELSKLIGEQQLDVTVDQYVVLNRLCENEGISQSELAHLTYKDKSSITRIIDLLEKKDLAERRSIPGDRRSYQVYAKPSAFQLTKQLNELARKNIERGTRNIPEGDINHLIKVLNKIHSNYQE